jgi:uridine kinase
MRFSSDDGLLQSHDGPIAGADGWGRRHRLPSGGTVAIDTQQRTVLVAIAGCSGSGKSTLARNVAKALKTTVIPVDAYYRDRSDLEPSARAQLNFDTPEALEKERLVKDLRQLTSGRSIRRPVYDFATHTRAKRRVRVNPRKFVVLEGLFALFWPEVRDLCAARVYVKLRDETCYKRRLHRDTRDRGRTVASVERQYRESVSPMAELHIKPTEEFANVVVSGAESLEKTVSQVLAVLGRSAGSDRTRLGC